MFPDGEVTGTKTKDLRRHLERFGCKVKSGRLLPLRGHCSELTCDAILQVSRRMDGTWHWVVWDSRRGRILDPLDPPLRRRPESYLLVRRPNEA